MNPMSERYRQARRLNIDLNTDHVPVPNQHRPRLRLAQQDDGHAVLYEEGNAEAHIEVQEEAERLLFDAKEVA